jgi:hypothetical protein
LKIPPEQTQLKKLKELLQTRIPHKWWWTEHEGSSTLNLEVYNQKGKLVPMGLFEAIDETIKIAQQKEKSKGKKESHIINLLYSNINEILNKVAQLQLMERIMQKIDEAEQGTDEKQRQKLEELKHEEVTNFKINKGIVTTSEQEITQKILKIQEKTQKEPTTKAATPQQETQTIQDPEITSLLEKAKKINYRDTPLLQGIQNQIDKLLEKISKIQNQKLTQHEKEEIISQLKFWTEGEKYFPKIANITLEALEPGHAHINNIPPEYIRTFIEHQNQIPIKLDLTNQTIIVTQKEKQNNK